jgi:hypothetical protein
MRIRVTANTIGQEKYEAIPFQKSSDDSAFKMSPILNKIVDDRKRLIRTLVSQMTSRTAFIELLLIIANTMATWHEPSCGGSIVIPRRPQFERRAAAEILKQVSRQ